MESLESSPASHQQVTELKNRPSGQPPGASVATPAPNFSTTSVSCYDGFCADTEKGVQGPLGCRGRTPRGKGVGGGHTGRVQDGAGEELSWDVVSAGVYLLPEPMAGPGVWTLPWRGTLLMQRAWPFELPRGSSPWHEGVSASE